ncbi:hypothetical protein AGABI1DRAFT_126110 [Agaricus bisporus var. burnettii JB137-S8]|uniref:Uncharacterized protein n=1 Tax=Agaricus bisporus var. burnettii (strain JB137-S8 / ATCC MYA-4627 / FGSC 10392) TaxID=597362 RepID=K5Y1Q6_AGABU|nr:uncharacterized protein AGABI1DRAFT_126110 [Agaricus bisporus var. burnettii JB137-S8]EKM81750.1 hypothetical protein AGABI1DRAFT_126110 [Agaricus bisporus var. burnettii JB137-S8]
MVFWVTFLAFLTVSVRGALSYLLNETVWISFDPHPRDVLALATSSLPQLVVYNDAYDGNVGPHDVSKIKAKWRGGGYLKVHQGVGNLIDWYNVQFDNQGLGVNEYTACNNLPTASSSTWPKTSAFEIAASVIPLSKIVIGNQPQLVTPESGSCQLRFCAQQAKSQGWNAGIMTWQYPQAASPWITSVRSLSWPV